MRLLLITALAALASTTAAAQEVPRAKVPPHCKTGSDKAAATRSVRPRKLDEMPPANQYKAVWRTDERGCTVPVLVREDIGANPG